MEPQLQRLAKPLADQCFEHAARRRALFRYDGVWALCRIMREWGQGSRLTNLGKPMFEQQLTESGRKALPEDAPALVIGS